LAVTPADLVCLFLLIAVLRADDENYWNLFRIERKHTWGDLLALLGLTMFAAPLTFLMK
jgi:hypothetical protein